MNLTEQLKKQIKQPIEGVFCPEYFRSIGYQHSAAATPACKRADGITALFTKPMPYIYPADRIVGSLRPLFVKLTDEQINDAKATAAALPERTFITNFDHYSPDYTTLLSDGISGILARIRPHIHKFRDDPIAVDQLTSMYTAMEAMSKRLLAHADAAKALLGTEGYDDERLLAIATDCRALAYDPPKTFAQGLQLLWMAHTCFLYEGRYAMALGRMDQYLYPLYLHDREKNGLTAKEATELIENMLIKICERRALLGNDDVVNICLGGVDENGICAVNELSLCILHAVNNIHLPGPNLSVRVTPDMPDAFLDECLKVIGTGLGYPALMNDTVNMAALRRFGYAEKDILNYSMVGCIENFITGMQPPWSDGRFDTPRFLEYVLREGEGFDKNRKGLPGKHLDELTTMDAFMAELERQLANGVKEYVDQVLQESYVADPENYTSPFLSCFCKDCIKRGRDINMGGSRYPSAHGAVLMGVGTMSDSLAAIEKVVFNDKDATLSELADAIKQNFEGYEALHQKLLSAPKYGNNDPFADKYAVWFTTYLSDRFDEYHTHDGGAFYTAMAANTSNIYAGQIIGATPDGRLAMQPLSDAASPTYGRDTKGATSSLLSTAKPDYTRCACGTVVNQKYAPSMFADGKREKLLKLIRVYFEKGGQELQINATSREILEDAIKHPENYPDLVVRVSGFSALYVTLTREVQEDILRRTQKE